MEKKLSEKIWVEIETTKKTTVSVSSFRGLIDKDVFDAIINETYTKKWIKLDAVFWNENEYVQEDDLLVINRILGDDMGKYHDFTGEMFIQTDTIVVIYLLNSEIERHTKHIQLERGV